MSGGCTFIRLLAEEDKGVALAGSIRALQRGEAAPTIFPIASETFSIVPGSPFAYWVSDRIRRLFKELPPFGGEGRTIKQGLATADDFRFVRAWWEVTPSRLVSGTPETPPEEFRAQTFAGKRWVPFAKGGEYSPYYADVHLVVNWERDGEEIRNFADLSSGKVLSRPQNTDYYFRPGLTWSLRTQLGFSMRQFPAGAIFGHKGPVASADTGNLPVYLSISNSVVFSLLLSLQMAFGSYEVGVIQRTPLSPIFEPALKKLKTLTLQIIDLKRNIDINNESTHPFVLPSMVTPNRNRTLTEYVSLFNTEISKVSIGTGEIQHQIDTIAFDLYGINDKDRKAIEEAFCDRPAPINAPPTAPPSLTADLLSYILGAIFGRWDVRYATGERQPPELPDPFAPLPACSPGMLQGGNGLPLEPNEIPADYPLVVDPDGILVDDEGHPDDIIARIRDVLVVIWGDRADAIEKEACEILGIRSLRDYFRKPGAGGFWDDHVKRYSKSRRKAPIYWLLQSAKKNYGIWIYYPRMDGDTLYKALRYAKDKLAMEARRLEDVQKEREQSGTGGAVVKKMEKEIDGQEAFISELHDFVEKLERAASLNLIPEHDDGVVLTIAPLRELVPWNEPKNYWDELIEGKYAWSSIGKQLAEKGLVRRS